LDSEIPFSLFLRREVMEEQWRRIAKENSVSMHVYIMLPMEGEQAVDKTISVSLLA